MRSAWFLITTALILGGCKKPGGSSSDSAATATGTAAPPANIPATIVNEQPFAGTYTKYAVTTFKNGQRVVSTNNTGASTITIAQGLVTWAQTYTSAGKVSHVTQTYTYSPEDVRPASGGFDVALKFQKMDADTKSYSPDRNSPKLQARKQTAGWQIGLLTTDNNGVSGGVEFK